MSKALCAKFWINTANFFVAHLNFEACILKSN